jgi:hypothetical protein
MVSSNCVLEEVIFKKAALANPLEYYLSLLMHV